uniref:Uncharacterized protein n=1 Tax=Caenorhabditis japonica TaxID=281687 RepID=A0A8R1INQ4_CAEJA
MNADPFSITSKNSTRPPRGTRGSIWDPICFHSPTDPRALHIYSTPAWIHGDPRQNNPRSLHGGAWIYIGSYMDPIHVPSVSDPFWHYLPPPVTQRSSVTNPNGILYIRMLDLAYSLSVST